MNFEANAFMRMHGMCIFERHDDHIRRYRISKLPRVSFVFGRDYYRGPETWHFGCYWDREFAAQEGDLVYRRSFVLHIRLYFRAWIER